MRTGKAEFVVLALLVPGGMLTVDQIAAQGPLTAWTVRRAIGQLTTRGQFAAGPGQARWFITPRGLAATAATIRAL